MGSLAGKYNPDVGRKILIMERSLPCIGREMLLPGDLKQEWI
jgi:hypothetical protein